MATTTTANTATTPTRKLSNIESSRNDNYYHHYYEEQHHYDSSEHELMALKQPFESPTSVIFTAPLYWHFLIMRLYLCVFGSVHCVWLYFACACTF